MKMWALGLVGLLASFCATPSFAESVTVTANGASIGVSGMNVTAANVGSTSYTGLYKWTVSSPGDVGGTTVGSIGTQFYTFCIQMGQNFSTGSSFTYNIGGLDNSNPIGGNDAGYIDSTAASQIETLVDQYYAYVNTGSRTINGTSYSANVIASAFQLAIWEIEYDGGAGNNSGANYNPHTFPAGNYFGSGNLTASNGGTDGSNARTLATYFLNNFIFDNSTVDAAYTTYALTNRYKQDQLLSKVMAVPLPAALPAGISMLLGLAVVQRMRSRRLRG